MERLVDVPVETVVLELLRSMRGDDRTAPEGAQTVTEEIPERAAAVVVTMLRGVLVAGDTCLTRRKLVPASTQR